MLVLAVDDETLGLETLTKAIYKADPSVEIASFSLPAEALEFAKINDIDVAFLDIQMAQMSGTALAKKLKLIKPSMQIIFATGFDNYMGDAFALHASGYILKPITAAKVKKELDNLNLLQKAYETQIKNSPKGLRFQCFGNFEAFAGTEVLHFRYDKTKELLAYLVSRKGALCSNGEIIINLFDDDADHESYLRGLRKDLMDCLAKYGLDNAIIAQRGKMGINLEIVSCDYYDFLDGNAAAINSYQGEFMAQYSWGEFTNASLMGV